MPAPPSSVVDPLWRQFETLIPPVQDTHPLGCHRPRIPDRLVFDKLLARLVLGGSYQKHADAQVSATTLRTRRDEWIAAGIFIALEQIVLECFDRIIGLELEHLTVDDRRGQIPFATDRTSTRALWVPEARTR